MFDKVLNTLLLKPKGSCIEEIGLNSLMQKRNLAMMPICTLYSYFSAYDKVIFDVDYTRKFIQLCSDKKCPACLFLV